MNGQQHPVFPALMAAAFWWAWACAGSSAELQRFDHVRLVENPSNDGDSFRVELDGKSFILRLYYVDCPERSAPTTSDAARLREQTRYWGLEDAARTVYFGREAKGFAGKALAEPFTVHTAFGNAPGRSAEARIYAFVTLADGKDLALLLVKNGLARTRGVGRETPDGVSRSEMIARLQDLELAAALKRNGIWKEADPNLIAALRQDARVDDDELNRLREQVHPAARPDEPVDPNTARQEELESIPGIGPTLARRIIDGRPYETLEDLLNVSGIGPVSFRRLVGFFEILPARP